MDANMTVQAKSDQLESLVVRAYRPGDQDAVSRLYTEGLLAGQITSNDTGADIENIHEAYLNDPRSGFWVAEYAGQVVGMIGVAGEEEGHTCEIRRLRVDKPHQHSAIPGRLIETALTHCRKQGYLKVVLDTRYERHAVLDLFQRFGFQHTRTKNLHGKELPEFYLDLYRSQQKKDNEH